MFGPESTGKTTLAIQLADHYKTAWVPEFARDYLQENGMKSSKFAILMICCPLLTVKLNWKITASQLLISICFMIQI
jgi:hypothetical protein